MAMRYEVAWLALLFSGALVAPAAAQASERGPFEPSDSCFIITQYQSWRAPDANTVYLRVLPTRTFRLDLSRACPALKWPNAYLILRPRGGERFCYASDFIMKVNTGKQGFNEPCIVKAMTLLTPQEAEAIPRSQRPP